MFNSLFRPLLQDMIELGALAAFVLMIATLGRALAGV